jgi:LDH2 family malate/lactate/ureidoglycolate dehydrogenase
MIVEMMASLLSGASPAGLEPRSPFNHFLAAFNIDAFMDVDTFKANMDSWLQTMQATPPAPGYERVLTPGQRAAEIESERLATGIPLRPDVVEWFKETAAELGTTVDF